MLSLSVGVLSAAALGYEVLLMRLFSEAWWQPFAGTVISLALLGYGASGTVLTLFQDRLLDRFTGVYRSAALGFAAAAPSCAAAAVRLPLNPMDLAWSPVQWGWFAALYGLLTVPFLLAAFCVGLALRVHGDRIPRLYAADLCGAGCGAGLVVAVLYVLPPERVVVGVGILACVASALAGRPGRPSGRPGRRVGWTYGVGALLMAVALARAPASWFAAESSPYKGIRQALKVPGAEVVEQRLHPAARLQVVDPGHIPLRHATGLSLHCAAELPSQQALYVDGGFVGAVDLSGAPYQERQYLECLPLAAPYATGRPRRVAVLAAGSGTVAETALHFGASRVVAVEGTGPLAELLAESHAGAVRSGRLRIVHQQPRVFLASSGPNWELIQVSTAEGGGGAPGLLSTAEDYLLTTHGVEAMLRRLEPGGVLCITVGFQVPPQGSIKLFATAVRSLERLGIARPGDCLAWFRTWNTSTVLVVPGGLDAAHASRLTAFCQERAFDVCYYPGISAAEANRYNVLERPYPFQAADALLGMEAHDFLRRYPYFVVPATDDRPFFHRFFRWRLVPEYWDARGRGGEALLPWGYLLTVAALGQALLAGALLILLPLWRLQRVRGARTEAGEGGISLYFGCIGMGFMLVEITVLKRLTLLLGHPVLSAAVALTVFLLLAGWGSQRLGATGATETMRPPRGPCLTVAGTIALVELVWWLLGSGADALPLSVGAAGYVAALCALAYSMGRPFPAGLSALTRIRPAAVPWAWGVNGFASVWSVIAGTLLAVHFGFHACLWTAAALYVVAGWVGGRSFSG